MKRLNFYLGFVCLLIALGAGACLPGPNRVVGAGLPGFWMGYWHGLIAPITFIASLFRSTLSMYEVHNSGGWYNLGFLLGLASQFEVWRERYRRPAVLVKGPSGRIQP